MFAEKLRKLGHTMDEENKFVQVKGLQAASALGFATTKKHFEKG